MRRLSASVIICGLCTRGSASEPVNQRHDEPAYAISEQNSDESEHHGVDIKLSYAQRILKQFCRRDKGERDDEADFSAFFLRAPEKSAAYPDKNRPINFFFIFQKYA